MATRARWAAAAAGTALLFAGASGRVTTQGVVATQGAAATGTIRGRIRLAAPAPPNPPIRMGADPACSALYSTTRPVQEFVVRSADGGLANAFVHLKGSFPKTPVPTAPVILEQQGCVYRPHVIGLRAGQVLRIANSDPTLHNVHSVSGAGNDVNVSRPAKTPPVEVTFGHVEAMLRLTCDIHSWMNIYVAVLDHPYFAVSAADGRFEIANVPAGRQSLEVWHERYGPLSATVDVPAGGSVTADFTYEGTEKAAPATVVQTDPSLGAPADLDGRGGNSRTLLISFRVP